MISYICYICTHLWRSVTLHTSLRFEHGKPRCVRRDWILLVTLKPPGTICNLRSQLLAKSGSWQATCLWDSRCEFCRLANVFCWKGSLQWTKLFGNIFRFQTQLFVFVFLVTEMTRTHLLYKMNGIQMKTMLFQAHLEVEPRCSRMTPFHV